MAKQGAAKEDRAPASIQNRRARYDYHFVDTFEAGIALAGSEVKSLYLGRAHLTDAFCKIVNDELFLLNLDIEPYDKAAHFQPERRRDRKLLMHRKEIDLLERRSLEKGLSLIPARIYFKNGRVKVEIALARGKAQYDKREKIAKDEARREVERARVERF
ncbi:MAG TPA: SsrA-binding protein SmpB [Fimbriimonadaceae bacterium]|nr:SsrA-binding protein SmpB [Fimbriimonadaceae bacterium]